MVQCQQQMLAMQGFHVVFDVPCSKKGFERLLPSPIVDGFTVVILVYQKRITSRKDRRFRFSINAPRRNIYVEIGDYTYSNFHYVSTVNNHVSSNVELSDLVPEVGDYFWVKFIFDDQTCKLYFKDELVDTRNVIYDPLKYLYVHTLGYNGTDVLSYHIVMQSGNSPLQGNLPSEPLGFIFVTARVMVYGNQSTSNSDNPIRFYVYEYGSEDFTTHELPSTVRGVTAIGFKILCYGAIAEAGGTSVAVQTKAMGYTEVIIRIVENFDVTKVVVYTGMYDGW